jgi:hypothetical protein
MAMMMENISIRLVSEHIDDGSVIIDIRRDRLGSLLLRKSIKYLNDDCMMPEGLLPQDAKHENQHQNNTTNQKTIDLEKSIGEIVDKYGHEFLIIHAPTLEQPNDIYTCQWDFSMTKDDDDVGDVFPIRTECWQCNAKSNEEV